MAEQVTSGTRPLAGIVFTQGFEIAEAPHWVLATKEANGYAIFISDGGQNVWLHKYYVRDNEGHDARNTAIMHAAMIAANPEELKNG